MTTLSRSTTSTLAQITSPPRIELHKRAGECGDLQGQYPNAAPPTCAGSYSKCTFSAGQQGCCDGLNNCQFFTSCNGGLASGAARCTAAACLQCLPDKPYCTRYKFTQGVMAYAGFACGVFSIPDSILIQGIVATGQTLSSNSSALASTTSSTTGSSTSQTSRFSGTSSTSSKSLTSSSSVTATAIGSVQSSNVDGLSLSKGVIIGIAVGGFGFLLLCAILLWYCCYKRNNRTQKPMLEQMRN